MNLKKIILSAVLSVVISPFAVSAQQAEAGRLFEYPEVPDKLTKINMRSNFMVEHLWDKSKIDKENVSDLAAFHETFTDYLSFFMLADRPVVEESVRKYVEKVAKNAHNLNLTVGVLNAEVFNIRGHYCSDDVYGIFAKCLTENKRVPKELKELLQTNAQMLVNSAEGVQAADMPLVKSPSGAASLSGLDSEFTVLFFNAEGCVDCSIYKVRLSADIAANDLIEKNVVSIVSVYPDGQGGLDERLSSEPQNWHAATLAGFKTAYDMRIKPAVYVLDKDKKILAKFLTVENMLDLLAKIGNSRGTRS